VGIVEDVYAQIVPLLDITSVEIDLALDLSASLLFQDYPSLEERLEERSYYSEDIQTKKIFYYFYQAFPNIVDEILLSEGLKIRVQLQSQKACDEMIDIARKFYLLADTLIMQSSFSQPEEAVMEVGWADHYHGNEVEGVILERKLLKDWLRKTKDIPLLGGIIYLPFISGVYHAAQGLGRYTKEDEHINRIQDANMKLDAIPSAPPKIHLQNLNSIETTCVLEIPYVDKIPLSSLRKLREDDQEYFVAYRKALIESFNRLWVKRKELTNEFDEVKYQFMDVARAMRQELGELERSGLISTLGGEIKLFRAEITHSIELSGRDVYGSLSSACYLVLWDFTILVPIRSPP